MNHFLRIACVALYLAVNFAWEMKRISYLLALAVFGFICGCAAEEPPTLDPEEQLAAELEVIDNFLSTNGITAEEHESGLRYVINEVGSGTSPTVSNTVTINYEGRFLTGEVFDAGESATFPLGNLISGWQIGLPLISEGGSISLYIPSLYGYGPNGAPGVIPGNTPLVFDVDLISVQ